jgi:hypothetical protein
MMTATLNNANLIEALEKGAATIDRLRRHIELLSVKADAFDTISGLVGLLTPRVSSGYEPDASYIMRDLAKKLRAETEVPKSDT